MARSRKFLTVGAVGVAAVALMAATTSVTGAYFSEAAPGNITGTIGSVHLATSPSTFAWNDMMPGEQKTATVDFRNTGTGAQDFYLVFTDRSALHAVNNLGSYGEVHVTGGQTGNIAPLFDSANLQDGRHAVGTNTDPSYNSCSNDFTPTGCWPLPTNIKLASNVAAQGTGSVSFSFNYAGKLGNGTSGGPGVFNTFPLTALKDANNPLDQVVGTQTSGLPFSIVAVQVGQTP